MAIMETDPLKNWEKTTLWLRLLHGHGINIDVWYPSNISEIELVKLLQKHASQGVDIIRKLTGSKEMIIQSQYKKGKDTKGYNRRTNRNFSRIMMI